MTAESVGALAGVRVLDFTQVIFGPSGTAILADHGAEVIKVERPGQGDLARAFDPFVGGESMPYATYNRNKKGLAVDLKTDAGREIVLRLVPTVDVVASNFRAGVMESLGLGYEALSRINPRLVYVVGSGYGQTGPYAERGKGGHESVAQALSGVLAASFGGGEPPGRRLGLAVADVSGGHLLAEGVLLALLARERTGRGQRVEVNLLDGALWLQGWAVTSTANTPKGGGRRANPLDGGIYRTRDGYIVVTGLFKPNPLRDICRALEIEDLSLDPRFASVAAMSENAAELRARLQERLAAKSSEEWVELLEAADVLCAPIKTLAEAIEDPQVLHNEMVVEAPHPALGTIKTVGVPVKLKETPGGVRTPPPRTGEHTRELLAELGYDEKEVNEMRESGVVTWPTT